MKKVTTLLLFWGLFSHLWAQTDTVPPTVVCINGLSVNLISSTPPQVTLFASDFLQLVSDNQTPFPLLEIGIRKAGQGTGFPVLSSGAPQQAVVFNCDELGTNFIELWARDTAGNSAFCETSLLLQDNLNACGVPEENCIYILTEDGNGVEGVSVTYNYTSMGIPGISSVFTDAEGLSCLALPLPSLNISGIIPDLDADHRNGITVHDFDLIRRHIIGVTPLFSPYKIIAADANRSGSVTTIDLLELRRLILGVATEFTSNTSWRFVDQGYVFPDPSSPFGDTIPEIIDSLNGFVGIKIGDVDGSALANSAMSHPVLTDSVTVFFDDRVFVAGDTFQVGIRFPNEIALKQMTLELKGLRLVEVAPVALTLDDFGVFPNDTVQYLTMMGYTPGDSFSIRLAAGDAGVLRERIRLSHAITRSFGMDNTYHSKALRLQPSNVVSVSAPPTAMVQSTLTPNPCSDQAVLSFHLPVQAQLRIWVTDALGRVVLDNPYAGMAGINTYVIPAADWHPGLFHYRISTAAGETLGGGRLIKN